MSRAAPSLLRFASLLALLLVGASVGCWSQSAKPTTSAPSESKPKDLDLDLSGLKPSPEASETETITRFDDKTKYYIRRDQFIAADDPECVPADQATFIDDDDEVLGFVVNDQARAYTVQALSYHHVVNDRIGDATIAVTY